MTKEVKLIIFPLEGTLILQDEINPINKKSVAIDSIIKLKILSLSRREDVRIALVTKFSDRGKEEREKALDEFVKNIFINNMGEKAIKDIISVLDSGKDLIKPLTIKKTLEEEFKHEGVKVIAMIAVTNAKYNEDPQEYNETVKVLPLASSRHAEMKKIDAALEEMDKKQTAVKRKFQDLQEKKGWLHYSIDGEDEEYPSNENNSGSSESTQKLNESELLEMAAKKPKVNEVEKQVEEGQVVVGEDYSEPTLYQPLSLRQ